MVLIPSLWIFKKDFNKVFFLFSRYGPKSIPTTFIGLEKWLQELWREKDQLLENVYKEGIRFPANSRSVKTLILMISMKNLIDSRK
jgi:hypothetical protein